MRSGVIPERWRRPGSTLTGMSWPRFVVSASLLCAIAAGVAIAGCGGGGSVTISGCGAGRGSPITADEVLAVFNDAGYELRRDDCNVRRQVALLNNGHADEAESRKGHVLCGVEATKPPGRASGLTEDRPSTSGFDVGVANVTCTLYSRGGGEDEGRQVAELKQTVAALAAE